MNGYTVKVRPWSGNVQPWRAEVFFEGKYIGSTGGCKGPCAAERAAKKVIGKHWEAARAAERAAKAADGGAP